MYSEQQLTEFFKQLETYMAEPKQTIHPAAQLYPSALCAIREQLASFPNLAMRYHPERGAALHYVALNIKLLELLCEYQAPVNADNLDGETLCHILAATDKTGESLQVTFNHGINPLLRNKNGFTALEIAEHHDNQTAIRLLKEYIEKGPENIKRYFLKLINAYLNDANDTHSGTIELNHRRLTNIIALLNTNPTFANLTIDGTPILHHVAKRKNTILCELLCTKEADVHALDNTGQPLCNLLALLDMNAACIKIVLAYGADPLQKHTVTHTNGIESAKYRNNGDALYWFNLYLQKKPSVVDTKKEPCQFFTYLKRYVQEPTPYGLSIIAANLKEKNTNTANAYNTDGVPALHYAILNNNPILIRLLCAHGAKINNKDSLGVTALMRAAQHDTQGDCLQTLLEYAQPADRNERTSIIRDPERNRCRPAMTALDFAIQVNNIVAIKLLAPKTEAILHIPAPVAPPTPSPTPVQYSHHKSQGQPIHPAMVTLSQLLTGKP